mgnify:CR=1 FL=1
MKKAYEPPRVEYIPIEMDCSLIAASGPGVYNEESSCQQLSVDLDIWPEKPLKDGPWDEQE